VNIVWLKRDLRLRDHAAIKAAVEANHPFIFIYIFDPRIVAAEDSDVRHWRFVQESLSDLNIQLKEFNTQVYAAFDNSETVFQQLIAHHQVNAIYSHQETGNRISYDRDLAVQKLLNENAIPWHEFQTNGVIRGLKDRSDWDTQWRKFMIQPPEDVMLNASYFEPLSMKAWKALFPNEVPDTFCQHHSSFQPGGEKNAWRYLQSFLQKRHENYSLHISKPLLSRKGCSRLSPFLAYGNVSIRQVYQMTLALLPSSKNKRSLYNFISRLHWHCHFIQKFESECRIEFENFNKAYDAIIKDYHPEFIQAFENGQTGIPIVDANIRCLKETGYTNFRMRAMLVSFFCFNLWQDWRHLHFLARQFLDYEPGIHYAQLQMQAGTTGINTLRIYNPIKNALDHDPEGAFVKQWIPELAEVPFPEVHTPWKLEESAQLLFNCRIGINYPAPIIDIEATQKKATEFMWTFKKSSEAKEEGKRILSRHVKSKPMRRTKTKKS
jgi:deoxyribodipyrimidine photo-lyase